MQAGSRHRSKGRTPARSNPLFDSSGLRRWWRDKAPVLRFVTIFAGVVGVFYVITRLPFIQTDVSPRYFNAIAEVSGAVLRLFGGEALVQGHVIASGGATVSVVFGCDGSELIVFLAAAILAVPTSMRARLWGILCGVPLLLALNVFRIVTLVVTQDRRPEWFDALHNRFWQPVFIVAVMLIWCTWAILLFRRRSNEIADARDTLE